MTTMSLVLSVAALALAGACLWLLVQRARLIAERDQARQRVEDLQRDEQRARERFQSLAGEALRSNSEQFIQLARQSLQQDKEQAKGELDQRKSAIENLIKPINEKLEKTSQTLQDIEQKRRESFGQLSQQAKNIAEANESLRAETGKLVQALRKPQVRGRYGEIQLRRVVELAGMRDYCDFDEQSQTRDSEGRALRPDMVVRLPNERQIAIDAKTNLEPYLDAIEADSTDQAERTLQRFADAVADQAQKLAKKSYWSQYDGSPEFVVMFIPGDQFIDAALQRREDLLDLAAQSGVIIASPSTLIGLLRAVHVGWREKQLSDSAQELFRLGRELHERTAAALERAAKVGEAIESAAKRYNTFVGSVDSRLMPSLRKFEQGGAGSSKKLVELRDVEENARSIQSLPDGESGALENEPSDSGS